MTKPRRRRARRWPLLAGAAAVIALLVWGFLPQPLAVDTASVAPGRLRVTVDADGFARVKERFVITAPTAGFLHRIELEPGDQIADGTTLARIDPLEPALLDARAEAIAQARVKTASAALDQARANARRASVRTEHARAALARAQELFGKDMRSREALDRAQLELDASTEDARAAEAAVKVAEFQLELERAGLQHASGSDYRDAGERRITVASPIAGRVFRVVRESEGPVQAGAPLLEIADATSLEIVADFLSVDAVKIAPGAAVRIDGWGGERELRGRVRLVEPSGFTKISALGVEEQRVNVVVDFVDPPEVRAQLGDGFRTELAVIVHEVEDALLVPTGSLFPHGEGYAAFVVAGGAAHLRPVQIGARNGLFAQVLGGLAEGETVVQHPGERVADGVAVRRR